MDAGVMDKILVVDFGSQFAHLIAQSIRKLGVYAEMAEPDAKTELFNDPAVKGIVWSGGPSSVYDPDAPPLNPEVFTKEWILSRSIPFLFTCYGHQLAAQIFAKGYYTAVEKKEPGEYGPTLFTVKHPIGILEGLNAEEMVLMSHEDNVVRLPPDFMVNGSTENCPNAAVQHIIAPLFGIQFHAEVSHTSCGTKIFDNFLKIANARKEWTPQRMFEETREILRNGIKGRIGILLASGGVDSTVLAELAKQEFPEGRLHMFHIDTGFERKREPEKVFAALTGKKYVREILAGDLPNEVEHEVLERWRKKSFTNLHLIRAGGKFRRVLRGVADPEEKRKIIGELFIKVVDEKVKKLGLDIDQCVLLQGTIYPDTIESARTRHAERIKTHHNRVDAVQKLIERGAVIEPLQYLYKDEVRQLGEMLKVDPLILNRHPFPGPGLAVRILCSNESAWPSGEAVFSAVGCEPEIFEMLNPSQFHGYVLPLKSVGVEGDQRTYAFPCAITGPQDWEEIERLSSQITNRFKGKINRVAYLIAPLDYHLSRLNVRKAFLTKDRISLAQEIDWIVQCEVKKAGWYSKIWQLVTVLAPLSRSPAGSGECAIIRFVQSVNAMTATNSRPPWPLLETIASKILKLPNIEAVFYDPTPKPPATIEWE